MTILRCGRDEIVGRTRTLEYISIWCDGGSGVTHPVSQLFLGRMAACEPRHDQIFDTPMTATNIIGKLSTLRVGLSFFFFPLCPFRCLLSGPLG